MCLSGWEVDCEKHGRSNMRTCTVEGCEKRHYSNGLCAMHRWRLRKNGSVNARKSPAPGEAQAFLIYASKMSCEECITWPFEKKNGYGQINFNGVKTLPSRAVCILAHGEPSNAKLQAAHSCGNGLRGCVNPRHLRWATRQENLEDMEIHGTRARGSKIGSAKLTEENVRQILKMRGKETHKKIAEIFSVDRSTISRIMNGHEWSWLTKGII